MTPNQENLAFFRELGGAIQQWQQVELALYEVVKACCDEDPRDIYHNFYSHRSFEARMNYADSLILPKLTDTPFSEDWQSLRKRIRNDAQQRNKIAHYLVLISPDKRPTRRFGLWPPQAKAPKADGITPEVLPASGVLGVKELWLRARRFSGGTILLRNFASRVQGQENRCFPNPQTPSQAPTLAQLVKEIQDLACGPQ
jgi:hypothetical protein